jgi:FixJ family two-component response regulator
MKLIRVLISADGESQGRIRWETTVTGNDLKLDGLSVLVLEDEFILADDATRVLLRAGAEVMGPFGVANAALAAAERRKPDCALLDVDLGSGPDFEPARALKKRGVPLIFFTGHDLALVPADLRNERFLEKPVFMGAIVDIIALACGRTGGGSATEGVAHLWRLQCQTGF